MNKGKGDALDVLYLVNLQSVNWKAFGRLKLQCGLPLLFSPIARVMIICHL